MKIFGLIIFSVIMTGCDTYGGGELRNNINNGAEAQAIKIMKSAKYKKGRELYGSPYNGKILKPYQSYWAKINMFADVGVMSLAMEHNSVRVLSHMLDAGLNPNIDMDGMTPLMILTKQGLQDKRRKQMFEYFIKKGANINMFSRGTFHDKNNDTYNLVGGYAPEGDFSTFKVPSTTAICFAKNPDDLNYLIKNKATINIKNQKGLGCISFLIRRIEREFAWVRVWEKTGDNQNIEGHKNNIRDFVRVIKHFLSNGFNVEKHSEDDEYISEKFKVFEKYNMQELTQLHNSIVKSF